ncbi:hypothetical protein KKB99_06040 [bacterium]|nr:hypothetical protein [bacterium]MBU1025547.1 hypothetical protein [bacterium]
MSKETIEDVGEILEFKIPPRIGDEKIPIGYQIFDFAAIGVNVLFLLLWAAICLIIWLAIGAPFFILLWLIASFMNILTMPFRKGNRN